MKIQKNTWFFSKFKLTEVKTDRKTKENKHKTKLLNITSNLYTLLQTFNVTIKKYQEA